MNKNIIIAAIIVLLVIVGAGAYLMFKNSSTSPQMDNSDKMMNEEGAMEGKNSLKALLTSGQSQMCTFKDLVDDADYNGTVYVAGGKMRGDFTSTTNGQTYMTHMIIKDNTMHSWTDGQATGFTMAFDVNAAMNSQEDTKDAPKTVDIDKMIDYECSGWSVDESKFTPPASVKFQSMGEMMGPTGAMMDDKSGSSNSQCAACNALTGDEKTQCLSVLNCN